MWLFNKTEHKKLDNIILNHSQWADSLTPGSPKVKIAINMGLFNADKGIGYIIEVKQICKSSFVYEPHKLKIKAHLVCTASGQSDDISVVRLDFIIEPEKYGVAAIFRATTEIIRAGDYTNNDYETTMKDFKKKFLNSF